MNQAADILDRPLAKGKHFNPENGACVMEWLRIHEGADFSDERMSCQCRILYEALVRFNDEMPDEQRQFLKQIALKSLGTSDDGRQQWRSYRLADVACREWAPLALEARGFAEQAKTLRALPPIETWETAVRANNAARDAASATASAAAAVAAEAAAAAAIAAAHAAHVAHTAVSAVYTAHAAASAVSAASDVVWWRAIELLEELVA